MFFEPNFQILVGLNESGKSNILKALSFLDPNISPEEDDIRDPRHDESPEDNAHVRFIFGLEHKETTAIYKKVKDLFQSKSPSKSIIQIGDSDYSLSEFCNFKKEGLYTINLIDKTKSYRHWQLQGSHYKIQKGWKKVSATWSEKSKFENANLQFINVEDYEEYKDIEELEDLTLLDLNSAVGTEINDLVNEKLFNCIVWKYTESNILPGRIGVEEFKNNPDICEPLRNIFYLSGYDDIPAAISTAQEKSNGIKNMLRRLSENTTKHLRRVWPEYKKISISLEQNGSVIEAGIEDEFNTYSLDRRSDGFKRFITFLLLLSVKAKADYLFDSLIIIDEPDIGLHPSGIQFIREELRKISSNNYIFIATHSIFMIDKDRIDRHLIVKKEREETNIISEYSSDMLDEEVIYRALGYSLFEILKSKNIIFEGWSDKFTFQVWLNSRRAEKQTKDQWKSLGLLHALGAKDVQRVASHLEDFDREYFNSYRCRFPIKRVSEKI
jgi:AAA15 family ATPase/GTPase